MKTYTLKVTYIIPRTGKEVIKMVGPVYTKKALNSLCYVTLRKRNCIGIETLESQ